MSNWSILKKTISDVIKTNDNQEITGELLQQTLLNIVTNVGANATFAGIATPFTNPGTQDGPIFYIATENGTYINFNYIQLNNEVAILLWKDGEWQKLNSSIFNVERVFLECTGTNIQCIKDNVPYILNFNEIIALVENTTKLITLYYESYEMYLAESDSKHAIFSASFIENGYLVTESIGIYSIIGTDYYTLSINRAVSENSEYKTNDITVEKIAGHDTYPTTACVNEKFKNTAQFNDFTQFTRDEELYVKSFGAIAGNNSGDGYNFYDSQGKVLQITAKQHGLGRNFVFNFAEIIGGLESPAVLRGVATPIEATDAVPKSYAEQMHSDLLNGTIYRDANGIVQVKPANYNFTDAEKSSITELMSIGSGRTNMELFMSYNRAPIMYSLGVIRGDHWDLSKVTTLNNAFYRQSGLRYVDLSWADVSNVEDFAYMFGNCDGLEVIDITGWRPGLNSFEGANFYGAFSNCYALRHIVGLDTVNTDGITSFAHSFRDCRMLEDFPKKLYLNFCSTIELMFQGCRKIKEADTSGWLIGGTLTNMNSTFRQMTELTKINVTGLVKRWATDINFIFVGCSKLEEIIGLETWDTSGVTNMRGFIANCSKISTIDIRGWNAGSQATDLDTTTFFGCPMLTSIIGGSTSLDEQTFIGLKVNCTLSSDSLARPSLRAIINGLADLSGGTGKTLTFGNNQKSRLLPEDIAVATAKNWTIV